MEKENIWPAEEKENGEGKGLTVFGEGKYLAQERQGKRREIFEERKYLVKGGEEEQRRKGRKIFGKGLIDKGAWPRKISQNLSFIFEYSRLQLQIYHITRRKSDDGRPKKGSS